VSDQTEALLVRAAMRLRAASPEAWSEFLAALDAHSTEARDRMLGAALELLPTAQGRAQSLRDLLKVLGEAPARFERLRALQGKL
jgi:hypothetical protein